MPARQTLSLTVFSENLIAGGLTSRPDGEQTSQIGLFNGATWHDMGGGINEAVTAVASYQGDLYVGGFFSKAGDTRVGAIAHRRSNGKWDEMRGGLGGDCCGSGTFV